MTPSDILPVTQTVLPPKQSTMVYTLVCHLTAKDDASIELIKNKLIEAAQIYRKDKEQIVSPTHPTPDVSDSSSSDRVVPLAPHMPTNSRFAFPSDCLVCSVRSGRAPQDWLVMQDTLNPRKFSIVERFEQESSQQFHLNNPYWKTFDPYVLPLLDGPIELSRHEELV